MKDVPLAKKLVMEELENGGHQLHHSGKNPESDSMKAIIPPNRCYPCWKHIWYDYQCAHELALDRKFGISKYAICWYSWSAFSFSQAGMDFESSNLTTMLSQGNEPGEGHDKGTMPG